MKETFGFGVNVIYLILCILSLCFWFNHMYKNERGNMQVKTRKLKNGYWLIAVASSVIAALLLAYIGKHFFGTTYYYALSASLLAISYVLAAFRIREHWFFRVCSYTLLLYSTSSYILLISAAYGWYCWSELEEE